MNTLQPKKAPIDPNTPKEVGKPILPSSQINRIRFNPNGKILAAACFDGTVKRWDLSGKEPVELPAITGHNGWVSAIVYAGNVLFSVDSWGRLTATDVSVPEPKTVWTLEAAHDGWVRAVAVSSDGSRVATCGRDGFVRLWNPKDSAKFAEFELKSDQLSVCFTQDGKTLFAGDLFGVVREFELPSGKLLHTFEAKELHRVDRIQDVGGARCLLLSGDGKTLFVAGAEPKSGGFVECTPLMISFDRSGKRVGHYRGATEKDGYITDLVWHPDGFVIGTTSGQPGNGKFFFWKPGEATAFFTGGKMPNCHSVALNPKSDTIAVSATNANSSGNGRVKGTGGEYPANTSPIQLWSLPAKS